MTLEKGFTITFHQFDKLSFLQEKKNFTRGGIRTRGLLLRRETRYPLRYTDRQKSSRSETRTHNLPVNSRARYRLRHPGTRARRPKKIRAEGGFEPLGR